MNTCVLIPSCDAFADVHAPFIECFKKYWPDCPYELRTFSESGWKYLPNHSVEIHNDNGWCKNLMYILRDLNFKFVIMWLDDMLLCEQVDTSVVQESVEVCAAKHIGAVRIGPGDEEIAPARWETENATPVGMITRLSRYRISTSPTVWDVNYLKQILNGKPEIKTAWDFEITGTNISRAIETQIAKVTSMPPPVQVLYTAITRGKFEEGALRWLEKINIHVKTDRPVKGWEEGQKWPMP